MGVSGCGCMGAMGGSECGCEWVWGWVGMGVQGCG